MRERAGMLAALAILIFAGPLLAQPQATPRKKPAAAPAAPPGPKPLSETLTGEAKADYDAAMLLVVNGDWAGAEVKLQAAYDRSHDARLLWNIASCEKSQRHYARTVALVEQYVAEGGDLLTPADHAEAKALLEAIEPFTVKLTVAVNEPGADVYVDDQKVGTTPLAKPVVVDIGTRKIEVRKPGFKDWSQSVPIGGSAEAKVEVTLQPEVHEGHLAVTTQPDAVITLDGQPVGEHGRFDAKVKSGGHQLRVEAPGMVPYQTEVVVGDDENRSVDVPLQRQYVPPPPEEKGPGFEVGLSDAIGQMFNGDRPVANTTRVDVGWRPWWPTNLGLFLQAGEINANGNCGTDVQAASSASPVSLGQRYSFAGCQFFEAGLQLVVHFLPAHAFDPWLAFEPAFRVDRWSYTIYDPLSAASLSSDQVQPGLDFGGRLGLDWHPVASFRPWAIGAFASLVFTFAGQLKTSNCAAGQSCLPVGASPSSEDNNASGNDKYLSMYFGLRTSLAF